MRNPNPALLLYIAMADAYAMSMEFVDRTKHADHFNNVMRFTQYVRHPLHQERPGMYSDDTEMSCAVARVLIAHPPPYEPIEFAQAWIDEFNLGGRRKGYARRFQDFLESAKDGADFMARIRNKSDKNGACMRAVPIGALPRVKDVLKVATLQARITHNTPPALFSARCVALMAHFALHVADDFRELDSFCRKHLPKEDEQFFHVFNRVWRGPVDGHAQPLSLETVHAVFSLIITNASLFGILEDALVNGGDTDSVAAVAWGIASTLLRQETVPDFMTRSLEPGSHDTGSGHLRELSFQLMQAYA